jgi:hypothetical protein
VWSLLRREQSGRRGREAGGARAAELGVCPAYPNHVTQCARTTGTLCGGKVQGTFAAKFANCMECDFYKSPNYRLGAAR